MPKGTDPLRATRRPGPARIAFLFLAVAALALLSACSRELRGVLLPDQRPAVRLTYAPVDTTRHEFYVYRMYWTGFDADGRVVRYEYAVDPPDGPNADTQWVATTANTETFSFSATRPESLGTAQPLARDFHVFVIRAVDNRGLHSEPVARAFYSYCVAPVVRILSPVPSALLSHTVPPAIIIRWEGMDFTDPTGSTSEEPLYYKYTLIPYSSEPRWRTWLMYPDSMRAALAPSFAGWDSTGPDSAFARYTGLTPNTQYLFVVVAFGRSGAYAPVWNYDTNILHLFVGWNEGPAAPVLTLWNSCFTYTYASGGFPSPLDSSWAIRLQVPAGQSQTFHWSALPTETAPLYGYRWVLDPASLDDETARSGSDDWSHWSEWNLATTSATVGPFAGGTPHDFFVQAKDVMGYVSLGWVHFLPVTLTGERDLLIVNDTRFAADMIARTQPAGRTDSLAAPSGVWPTRAELDTFLFAVGGVRWQMTPAGTLSPTGIFHGYDFDTLGTRYGQEDPAIPLNVLGQYRHIVWMTDAAGSRYTGSPTSATLPMTALRYMSGRSRQNTLAAWVTQGGSLWALGGGFGNATNAAWNQTANDLNGVVTYTSRVTSTAPIADLVPGRFMYDLAHWRSEFRILQGFIRFARYDQRDPTTTATGAWAGRPLPDPRYEALPTQLLPRTPATDPLWPFRGPQSYYVNNPSYTNVGICTEYLAYRNSILETVQATPESSYVHAALDTLYLAYAPAYAKQMLQAGEGVNGVMTYYHGNENGPVMFLGTSIWDYQRTHCQALVDVVLSSMWGLPKNAMLARQVRQTVARRQVGAAGTARR